MFEHFERYAAALVDLTDQELQSIRSMVTMRTIPKRGLLLKEGEICRCKFFVAKGLLRTYRLAPDGSEYVMRFASENTWINDPESYFSQTPSIYTIEALEPTEVIGWTKEGFEQQHQEIPGIRKLASLILVHTLNEGQNRILSNISSTPEEKYREFVKTYPDIFQRVPLHMVASYLGISRETLSRVRQALVKQRVV